MSDAVGIRTIKLLFIKRRLTCTKCQPLKLPQSCRVSKSSWVQVVDSLGKYIANKKTFIQESVIETLLCWAFDVTISRLGVVLASWSSHFGGETVLKKNLIEEYIRYVP